MAEDKTVLGEVGQAIEDFTPPGLLFKAGKKLVKKATGTTEATPPEPTAVEDRVGGGDAVSGGEFAIGTTPELDPEEKRKQRPSDFTLTGTQTAGLSEANQAVAAETQKRLEEAGYLDGASQLLSLRASERETANLAFVNEHASDLIEDLRINHFPQARAKIQKLQQDVDDARAMKINPYNWQESIGRGGRVAAAFSLLTGQLAAGAGNPNTALQMMDAAIERDIAAQDQNIKNQFEGTRLQKGLLQDERDLLTEEMAAINTNRAVKYAAIVARIQYAEQHAISESARLSLITMKDHYNVRLLQAIAAANAQYMTLHVKGPLRTRTEEADLRRLIKTKAALQEQLDASVSGQQALQASRTPIALSTGETAADLGFEGGPQQAPQQTQALPAGQARAATVASRRPSKAVRPSEATPTPAEAPIEEPAPQEAPGPAIREQFEDVETQTSRLETQEEADARVAEETKAEAEDASVRTRTALNIDGVKAKVAAGGQVTRQEMAQIARRDGAQGGLGIKRKDVPRNGGFAVTLAEQKDKATHRITRWDQAINALANKQVIPNGGMQHPDDADVVSAMTPAPRRGAFARGPGGERLYQNALRDYKHGQDFSEIYEAPGSLVGQRNNIKAGNRNFRILRSSAARTKPAEYTKLADDMAEMAEGVELLQQLANDIMEAGPAGYFTSEGSGIPGLTNDNPTRKLLQRGNIQGAMQFIKQNDPTARISDQDIKLGDKAMGEILSGTFKFVDFAQNVLGGEKHLRKVLKKYLVALAVSAQATYWKKHQNDLVPSAETARVLAAETLERQQFMNTVGE